jgi:SAM-dependent methyltransferase
VSPSEAEFWEARLAANPGVVGVGYLNLGRSFNTWMYRLRSHTLRMALRRLRVDIADKRVLDIGSGTGFYVRQWTDLGAAEVVGSDITSVAVERLSAELPGKRFVRFDVSGDVPTDLGTFDIVSAFDVLFHIVDEPRYEAAIANIARLLKPGGVFVFSDNFLHEQPLELAKYQTSRTLERITDVVTRAGFDGVTRRPMMVLMNAPLDARSKVPMKLWNLLTIPVRLSDVLGWLLGAVLFPVDLLLTRLKKESPTTEIAVSRLTRRT